MLTAGILILVALAAGVVGYKLKGDNVDKDLKELVDWRRIYLRKEGVDMTLDGYMFDLRSFDGGQTWYAVKVDDMFASVEILGKADDVYPGILERAGHIKLFDFCFEHGGHTLDEGWQVVEYRRLLKAANVTARPI